ncbi:MAG: single-stranded DNA-binding protein, partial [Armatimonadetes bacterium]|nr:single-stranded DNA-binding protein [Armatimonadota bacterium]
ILIGRVTADPELRYTPSGKPVVNFVIAVDRPKNADGKKEADFVTIVAWQKLAEICANYLNKGKLIAIDGRLQVRSFETQDGQKRKVYEVVANNMQMLSPRESKIQDEGGALSSESVETSLSQLQEPEETLEEIPF